MCDGFTDLEIEGALGDETVGWDRWEEQVKTWTSSHGLEWKDVGYNELLAFFIHRSLKCHYGSYEVQMLLRLVTFYRQNNQEKKIVEIFERLVVLETFKDLSSAAVDKFLDKLAKFTTCCTAWAVPDNKGVYRLSSHTLYDIDEEVAPYLKADKRFLIKLDK